MTTATTSMAAMHSINLTRLEAMVLKCIDDYGNDGCISDEVRSEFPELSYSSVTARFASLEKRGAIVRLGDTRKGESNRQQQVMRSARFCLGTTPKIREKREKNPFLRGLEYAVNLFEGKPVEAAVEALKHEINKLKGK
jgi:hypothetical protein